MADVRYGSVQIDGLNKTIKGLQKAGVEVEDLKAAFADIASQVARLASSFAPKRSGNLRATIRGNKAKNKAVVTAGKARVPYAGPINYGWPRRGIAPALFMQRADAALAPQALRLLESGLDDALRKADLT